MLPWYALYLATNAALIGEPTTANPGYSSIAFFFHSSAVRADVDSADAGASGVRVDLQIGACLYAMRARAAQSVRRADIDIVVDDDIVRREDVRLRIGEDVVNAAGLGKSALNGIEKYGGAAVNEAGHLASEAGSAISSGASTAYHAVGDAASCPTRL